MFGARWLPPEPPRGAARLNAAVEAGAAGLGRMTTQLFTLLLAVWAAVVVFRVAYLQQGNSLARFAADGVDRAVTSSFSIQFPWFDSVNAGVVLIGTPILVALWTRQAMHGREWPPLIKMAFGAALVGLSFLMLSGAVAATPAGGLVHWLWLFAFYVTLTIGELFILPIGLSVFGRLAPESARATMIAVWFSAAFVGGVVSGWVGGFFSEMGPAVFFAGMTLLCLVAAACLWALNRPALAVDRSAVQASSTTSQ